MRPIERSARDETVAQMTCGQHEGKQSQVREQVEQKIGHIDGMKAQGAAALPKRLLTQSRSVFRRTGGDHCTSLCLNKCSIRSPLFPVCDGQIRRWKVLVVSCEMVASVAGKVCGRQKRCGRVSFV